MGNRGGRPKKADAERKSSRIEIKCLHEQKQEITRLAKSYGMNISDYMVRKALGKKVSYDHVALLKEVHRIGTELARAGNNINQLAKYANILKKAGILNPGITGQTNTALENYTLKQEDIRAIFRKILREMNKE